MYWECSMFSEHQKSEIKLMEHWSKLHGRYQIKLVVGGWWCWWGRLTEANWEILVEGRTKDHWTDCSQRWRQADTGTAGRALQWTVETGDQHSEHTDQHIATLQPPDQMVIMSSSPGLSFLNIIMVLLLLRDCEMVIQSRYIFVFE